MTGNTALDSTLDGKWKRPTTRMLKGLQRSGLLLAMTIMCGVLGIMAPAHAQAQGLGGLFGNLAISAAASRLNRYINDNQPIVRDWSTVYPHVDELPGPPFQPRDVPAVTWSRSLEVSGYRGVALPPGDYSMPVQLFCMHFSGGSAPGYTYLLGPLRGTRAAMITRLMGRAAVRRVPHDRVQVLAWALQSGMTYEQLDPESRSLFDALLPEYRSALGPGPLVQALQFWQVLASAIPGGPSFNDILNRVGAAPILAGYQNAQQIITQDAGNFQQLSQRLLYLSLGAQGNSTTVKPWSIVAPGVYARMVTGSTAMGPGSLQFRILPTALAADHETVTVPIMEMVARGGAGFLDTKSAPVM